MSSLDRYRRDLRPSGLLVGGGPHITPGGVAVLASGWKQPVGMLAPNAPGAPNVTRVPLSWAGNVAGNAVWSLVDIAMQSRPIVGLDGLPLHYGTTGDVVGSQTGGTARVWCDLPLASACVAESRKALNDAIANRSSDDIARCAIWMANAYSALNIPWQCDPRARMLWRRYLSGPEQNALAEFDASQNWNLACTTANNFTVNPLDTSGAIPARSYVGSIGTSGGGASVFTGVLTAQAAAVFARCKPQAVIGQFIPQIWMAAVAGAGGAAGSADIGPNRNSDTVYNSSSHLQNVADETIGASRPFGYIVDASCGRQNSGLAGVISWPYFGFDGDWLGFTTPPLRFATQPSAYVAFFSAWLDALESRTGAQVILDARNFTIYLNAATIAENGGTFDSLARLVGAASLAEWTPDAVARHTLDVVRAGAPAVGAVVAAVAAAAAGAASAATAGIGALVIGTITAVAVIAGALVQPDESAIKLDDLLRARPTLERAWLDGNPGDLSEVGAPTNIIIPAPPDFSRYSASLYRHTAPPPAPAPPSSAGAKIATGLVLGGASLAVAQYFDLIDLASLFRSK